MKKTLFKATLREINYLVERDYLNEKGLEWAKSFNEDKEESCCDMDAKQNQEVRE